MVVCPNCDSANNKLLREESNELKTYFLYRYECNDCLCEFTISKQVGIDFPGKSKNECSCDKQKDITLVKGEYYKCDNCGGYVNENQ